MGCAERRAEREQQLSLIREHFRVNIEICHLCEHWTTSPRKGCGLLPVPCHIDKHLMKGGGCVADEPVFDALIPQPPPLVKIAKPTGPKKDTFGDWHCPTCGVTLQRREKDYWHRCPGDHPVPYQQERQRICNQCPHNVDDICVEYHALHPDRDCVISIGVEIPYAACPIGAWHQVQHDCEFCGRRTFDLEGIEHCRWCGGVS